MCRGRPRRHAPHATPPPDRPASDRTCAPDAPAAIRARPPAQQDGNRPSPWATNALSHGVVAPTLPRCSGSPQTTGPPPAPTCLGQAHDKTALADRPNRASSMLASSPVASLNHKIPQTGIPADSISIRSTLGEVVGDHPVAEMPPQSLDRGVVEGIYGRLLDRP